MIAGPKSLDPLLLCFSCAHDAGVEETSFVRSVPAPWLVNLDSLPLVRSYKWTPPLCIGCPAAFSFAKGPY